jgi:hypothetical protein
VNRAGGACDCSCSCVCWVGDVVIMLFREREDRRGESGEGRVGVQG